MEILLEQQARQNFFSDRSISGSTSFRLPHFIHVFTSESNSAQIVIGQNGVPATIGTAAFIGPDSANLTATSFTSTAVASVAVVAGKQQLGSISAGTGWTFGTVDRILFRVKLGSPAQSRYWIGINNDTASSFAATWATDTPNFHFAAFRAKSAEGTIKAICGRDSGPNFTLVDTGVPFDTTSWHNYEIVITATLVTFLIDGVVVAQISSNLPSAGDIAKWIILGDNLNTATAIAVNVQLVTELFLL